MIRIFQVTMVTGQVWNGCSTNFESACQAACTAFLAPERAVKSVKVVKIVE